MTDIKNFTIFGERCSGTHFVEYAIKQNFEIGYNRGSKHFFGHDEKADLIDNTNMNTTLFILLVRDPIDWIDSFFKRPHHVPGENRRDIKKFLTSEWRSVYESNQQNSPTKQKGTEIMTDRNIYTKERYINILELRKTKCNYFLNEIAKKVKYFYLLKYEDLRDDYFNTMEKIQQQFNLKKRHVSYMPITKYKGTQAQYVKKPILLTNEIKKYILEHLDLEQENRIGYNYTI